MTEEKKPRQMHHELCGDVGATGEHGELGSNAAGLLPAPLRDVPDYVIEAFKKQGFTELEARALAASAEAASKK